MFALCILKLVAADTINDKFCSCKLFKELSWNKLEVDTYCRWACYACIIICFIQKSQIQR